MPYKPTDPYAVFPFLIVKLITLETNWTAYSNMFSGG